MVRLLRILRRASLLQFVVVLSLSASAGITSAVLLALIGRSLVSDSPPSAVTYVSTVLAVILASVASTTLLQRFSSRALIGIRGDLVRALMDVPLAEIERVGPARAQAAFSTDVPIVANTIEALVPAATAACTIIAATAYLAILSPLAFIPWAVAVAVVWVATQAAMRVADRYRSKGRSHVDRLFRGLRSVLDGAKEVRLDPTRASTLLEKDITASSWAVREADLAAGRYEVLGATVARTAAFVVIGALLFASTHVSWFSPEVLSQFLLVTVYVISPAETIFWFLPMFVRCNVAMNRLSALRAELGDKAGSQPAPRPPGPVKSLDVYEVVRSYATDSGKFTLGPITLKLLPGRVVFLVGGNGSGKTTLAKIICGLYSPDSGELALNGSEVTAHNVVEYRSHFAAVFLDYCLFDEYPEYATPLHEAAAARYLKDLKLEGIVTFSAGRFSTTSLSSGQKKRLALIAALLSDKPIFVFDEWASDQDPVFRHVFYKRILPDLRAAGKVVLAVTHDERYWDTADEVVKLDEGRITRDTTAQFIQRMHER